MSLVLQVCVVPPLMESNIRLQELFDAEYTHEGVVAAAGYV
jgi:hypothetical protein